MLTRRLDNNSEFMETVDCFDSSTTPLLSRLADNVAGLLKPYSFLMALGAIGFPLFLYFVAGGKTENDQRTQCATSFATLLYLLISRLDVDICLDGEASSDLISIDRRRTPLYDLL